MPIQKSKPRRESEDSSYFSDASHASPYSCPATPPMSAKEMFRSSLNEDIKKKAWIKVTIMEDEELFRIDKNGMRWAYYYGFPFFIYIFLFFIF